MSPLFASLLSRSAVIMLLGGLCCAACTRSETAGPVEQHSVVTISVAASAEEVITRLAAEETRRTGNEIRINGGPTSSLAQQIQRGAPAELFLSANRTWADTLAEQGLVARRRPLLTNRLVLVVPPGNPGRVREPDDLTAESVWKVALAGEHVPAGIYAEQALKKLDLLDRLAVAGKVVRGQDVRSTLSYVERGEAEAGIVYSTDLRGAEQVEMVHEFDPALHDEIVYVLVLLRAGEGKPAAEQFYESLLSSSAAAMFKSAGFMPFSDSAAARLEPQ